MPLFAAFFARFFAKKTPQPNPLLERAEAKFELWALALALLLGAVLRFWRPITADFPLGDGGLFYAIARDIAARNFALPSTVFYPTQTPDVPLAYPPLAFYVAALWSKVFSLESAFLVLPAIFSLALVVCFWRFCRVLLRDGFLTGAATLFYSASLSGFSWHIMGGGLPRALGLCFVFLALERAATLWRATQNTPQFRPRREVFWAGLWLGLAILTHLERAQFGFLSLAVLCLFYGRTPRAWGQLALICGGACLVCAPWLALCFSRWGLEPFVAAAQSGADHTPASVFFGFLLFSFVAWRYRLWFVPVWLAVCIFLLPRSSFIFLWFPLSIAFAVLAKALVPSRWPVAPQMIFRFGALSLLLWLYVGTSLKEIPRFHVLSQSTRQAFDFVRENTPPDARFLLTPVQVWSLDLPAEWFPALRACLHGF